MASDTRHQSEGNLKTAFFLNLGFTLLEIVGGVWTNSVAIMSDAVHDLGDSLSLGLAWHFDRVSERGRTARLTYGYRRYRLLGGLITGVVLLIGLGFVFWHSVQRLWAPAEVRAPGMILLAVVGIVFNGAAALRLRSGTSLTEKLVGWHLIEDTLGWGAVLVGACVMTIWDVPIVDPILSIGISMVILLNVGRNLKKVASVFLQSVPDGFDVDEFERRACAIPGVASLHHIHSWSIDGESHVFSTHIVRDGAVRDDRAIKEKVRGLLNEYGFEHVTLETEGPGEEPHKALK